MDAVAEFRCAFDPAGQKCAIEGGEVDRIVESAWFDTRTETRKSVDCLSALSGKLWML